MKLANVVKKSLEGRGFCFTWNKDQTLFSYKHACSIGLLSIDIRVFGDFLSVNIFPGHVAPETRRLPAMEWVLRFNARAPQGVYHLNPDDGVMHFELVNRMSGRPTTEQVQTLVEYAVAGVCWSAPSLQEVLFHEVDPKESLASIEVGEVADDDAEDLGFSDEEFAAMMDDLTRHLDEADGDQ